MDTLEKLYQDALRYTEAGDIQRAVTTLTDIVHRDPAHLRALNDLGVLAFQSGDHHNGLGYLSRCYTLDPRNLTTQRNLAGAYESLGAYETATRLLEQALAFEGKAPLPAILTTPVRPQGQSAQAERLKRWEAAHTPATRRVADTALAALPEGGVMIDIGANIGLFSAMVLEKRNATAYLFEPVPEYFNYTAEKFRGVENVTVEQLGLSNVRGSFSLWVDDENLGWNTLVGEKRTPGMKEIVVPTETFDEYAERKGITRIDLIKIDVEGAEYRVLKGMERTIAKLEKKPVILCEIGWGPSSHPNWREEVEAFEWLFENGYQRFDYNVPGTTDVVFIPEPSGATRSTPTKTIADYILSEEGRFVTLDQSILPADDRPSEIVRFADLLSTLPDFRLHYGGSGDALLLLATMYDWSPTLPILSFTTSIPAAKAFWSEFPLVEKIYFVEQPEDNLAKLVIRQICAALPNCKGRGVTPEGDHEKEWNNSLNIYSEYGVVRRPRFTAHFKPARLSKVQVAIQPKGSCLVMATGKANTIDPALWQDVVRAILARGAAPVILGVAEEAKLFPSLPGCIDKRGASFGEQMQIVRGSSLVVGADSWVKTFAALSGIPAVVFPPLMNGELIPFDDPSAHVFLRPWEGIHVVYSFEEYLQELEERLPAQSEQRMAKEPHTFTH